MAALYDAASASTALRAIRSHPRSSFSSVAPRVVKCNVSPPASKTPAPPALQWQQSEASQHATTTTTDTPKEQLTSLSSLSAQNLSSEQVIAAESQLLLQTYARAPLVFVKGQGCWLTDAEGREYLDMTAGIAVNALGHGDVEWVRAITDQASILTHVSNLYYTVPQIRVAERLVNSSFAQRVFFTNSGTEAIEAAIKFARKYQRQRQRQQQQPPSDSSDSEADAPTEFVAFKNSFHGRTLGALALTSKVQYRTPFEPLMPGVSFVEYGDLEAVSELLKTGRVAAVFVEPVQGEGGVYPAAEAFLRGLRNVCDEAGALLVFDEIQCGLGRTGTLWAYELYGVEPDIMTLAKPIAGGLPMGAVLMTDAVASAITYGDHGSTFAGGPLVCTASLAVLDRLQSPGFLESVTAKGNYLRATLSDRLLGGQNPHVKEIRGMGLLVGIQLDVAAGPVVQAARDAGMILITAGKGDVIRLAPPLTISEEELNLAIDIIVTCLNQSL